MTIAIVCTAILAALVFLLGGNVSRLRGAQAKAGRKQYPADPADPLFIAIRAHANATEYVPTLIVLFLLVGSRSPSAWSAALIIAATAARAVHAAGMLSSPTLATPTASRLIGAIGTYLAGVALAVTAVASI
jgi:uncharacterized membrane protein YecN with MAPEG domain